MRPQSIATNFWAFPGAAIIRETLTDSDAEVLDIMVVGNQIFTGGWLAFVHHEGRYGLIQGAGLVGSMRALQNLQTDLDAATIPWINRAGNDDSAWDVVEWLEAIAKKHAFILAAQAALNE